ncbi:MAG: acetyl-CoA C-acyltransferase [Candidatus Marinimicrobia bacterium]|nr:acetyl-CoA C-acyltransferase [Candidatus Neomarinimicrobiota bacterium]
MTNVVIAGYNRSAFTLANKGALSRTRPDDIVATVIKALLEKSKAKPEDVEDLIMGCAFPEAEQGLNIGRHAVFLAGLSNSTAGQTVNRFCGSSMQSIHMAAGAIKMGAGEVFICAGIESMSRIPIPGFNPMPNPALTNAGHHAYVSMGETAENLAEKYKIQRAEQEKFALQSHMRAARAQADGKFKDEIIPVEGFSSKVDIDGCIRRDTTADGLAELKPAFKEKGTVTAGTSSPLTDGASAVLVCSEDYAHKNNMKPLARIVSIAVSGCAPEIMGIGPVEATNKALSRAKLKLDQIDIIELNEAFAAQALSVVHDLGISLSKTNIDGGAIALGHPLGASGARITGKAASLLQREQKKYALAAMCIGGGQGIATVLEAL